MTDSVTSTVSLRQIVFTARNLSKTYQMREVQVQALQQVDLDIVAGEFIVFPPSSLKDGDRMKKLPPA